MGPGKRQRRRGNASRFSKAEQCEANGRRAGKKKGRAEARLILSALSRPARAYRKSGMPMVCSKKLVNAGLSVGLIGEAFH